MLSFSKVQARITAVTPIAEKHGTENVPAPSLRIHAALPAYVLDGLDKGLRKALFRKPASDEPEQTALEGIPNNDGLTKVRFGKVAGFGWDEKFPGYVATFGSGLTSTTTETEVEDVVLSKIKFAPKDGVTLAFEASLKFEADAELIGTFGVMLGEMVELSLDHPALPQREIA